MGGTASKDVAGPTEMGGIGPRSELYPWRDLVRLVYEKKDNPELPLTEDLVLKVIEGIEEGRIEYRS